MSRHGWGRGLALVVFVGLAGCSTSSKNTRDEVVLPCDDGSLVIDGPAETTAARAQSMLKGLGVDAEVQHDGAVVRLECSADSGKKRFCLHLMEKQEFPNQMNSTDASNEKSGPKTVTRVTLDWENGADVPTEIRVKAGLGSLNSVGGIDLAYRHNL